MDVERLNGLGMGVQGSGELLDGVAKVKSYIAESSTLNSELFFVNYHVISIQIRVNWTTRVA